MVEPKKYYIINKFDTVINPTKISLFQLPFSAALR